MAITLFRSTYDEFDSSLNGGDITATIIETGVVNSFIPAVRPRLAELGGERWYKFFFKTDVNIMTIGLDITKITTSPTEEIYFGVETSHTEVENAVDKASIRLYGGFGIASIDSTNSQITADKDVTDIVKVNDTVTIYDNTGVRQTAMQVSAVSGTLITFTTWTTVAIDTTMSASSSILVSTLNLGAYIGIWCKEVIDPFTAVMEITPNDFGINIWYDLV